MKFNLIAFLFVLTVLIVLVVSVVLAQGSYYNSNTINVGLFEVLYPISNGTYTAWTSEPIVDDAYECIDDNWLSFADDDYIYATGTNSIKCSFQFPVWVGTATFDRIELRVRALAESGTGTTDTDLDIFCIEDDTEYGDYEVNLVSDYRNRVVTIEGNPKTGLDWDQDSISSMEWGFAPSILSGTPEQIKISQFYIKAIPDSIDGETTFDNNVVSVGYDFETIEETGLCTADYLGIYFGGRDFNVIPTYETDAFPNGR